MVEEETMLPIDMIYAKNITNYTTIKPMLSQILFHFIVELLKKKKLLQMTDSKTNTIIRYALYLDDFQKYQWYQSKICALRIQFIDMDYRHQKKFENMNVLSLIPGSVSRRDIHQTFMFVYICAFVLMISVLCVFCKDPRCYNWNHKWNLTHKHLKEISVKINVTFVFGCNA